MTGREVERLRDALELSRHTREMDFTGRSMTGMIYVEVAGFAEDEDLATWVERGITYARFLPPK